MRRSGVRSPSAPPTLPVLGQPKVPSMVACSRLRSGAPAGQVYSVPAKSVSTRCASFLGGAKGAERAQRISHGGHDGSFLPRTLMGSDQLTMVACDRGKAVGQLDQSDVMHDARR